MTKRLARVPRFHHDLKVDICKNGWCKPQSNILSCKRMTGLLKLSLNPVMCLCFFGCTSQWGAFAPQTDSCPRNVSLRQRLYWWEELLRKVDWKSSASSPCLPGPTRCPPHTNLLWSLLSWTSSFTLKSPAHFLGPPLLESFKRLEPSGAFPLLINHWLHPGTEPVRAPFSRMNESRHLDQRC